MELQVQVQPVNGTFSMILVRGRVKGDSILKEFTNGGCATNVTVFYDFQYENEGNTIVRSASHNCVAYNELAQHIVGLKAGTPISFVGRQRSRSYQQNGETRWITEIVIEELVDIAVGSQHQQADRVANG